MSDYEYSDSFISDDEPPKESKRKTQKYYTDSKSSFKSIYASSSNKGGGRGRHSMRGRGGKNVSRNSSQNEHKPNGVVQRMLSAKNHKVNELRNQVEEMAVALRDVQEENKLLKKMQRRQEKALGRYEDQESDLPQIIQKHQNEVRTLKETLRKTKEKYERTDRYLRDAEDELDKVKSKLKRYKGLVDSKALLERDELNRKNQQLEIDYEEREVRTKDLEKHISHLNKNHRHELGIEMARNRELQKQLDQLREDNENLQRTIKEKDKEIQIKNIYANRSKVSTGRLPASYGGTPLDTPPPRIRKRVPSLHELTPREKAKAFENRRREDEKKVREKRADGDGPKMAFHFSDDARDEYDYNRRNNNSHKEYSSQNNDVRNSSRFDKSYDYSPRSKGSVSKRESQTTKPPLPSGNKGYGYKYGGRPEQQENARRERDRKDQEDMERKRQQEQERREQEEWEERERDRREREDRERQDRERAEREDADWKIQIERDRLKREQEDRDRERREREDRERRETQERERREQERKEQERRARDERERIEQDEQLREERRKKDELLAKLKLMDDAKRSDNTQSKDTDTFFITSGNTESEKSIFDKPEHKRGKDNKNSTSFLFNAPTKEDTGSIVGSASSSKRSYSFTKPIENLHSGKPSHDDVTVPYIEKKKQQQNKNDLDDFGGYQPSFTTTKTQKTPLKKPENSVTFNSDFAPKNQKRGGNKLMADLFGDKASSSRKDDNDDDIFKPSTNKKTTVQSSNRTSFWDDDSSTTTKKDQTKRENSTSALFGGGTALVDDDVHKSDSSKLLPRRARQTTTTFHSRPTVMAVDQIDDDIEEVIL